MAQPKGTGAERLMNLNARATGIGNGLHDARNWWDFWRRIPHALASCLSAKNFRLEYLPGA